MTMSCSSSSVVLTCAGNSWLVSKDAQSCQPPESGVIAHHKHVGLVVRQFMPGDVPDDRLEPCQLSIEGRPDGSRVPGIICWQIFQASLISFPFGRPLPDPRVEDVLPFLGPQPTFVE